MRHRPTSRGFCTLVVLALAFWPLMDVWHERNTDSFLQTVALEGKVSELRFANDVKERLLLADKESLKVRWAITAGNDYQKAQIESAERMKRMGRKGVQSNE